MSVKIRLARAGATKAPFYRVVVADSRAPRDGRFIEILGRYNPRTDPSTIELDLVKVDAWLAKGAQPSETVAKLIAAAKEPGKAPVKAATISKKAQVKAAEAAKKAAEPAPAPAAEPAPAEAEAAVEPEPAESAPAEAETPAAEPEAEMAEEPAAEATEEAAE